MPPKGIIESFGSFLDNKKAPPSIVRMTIAD